MNSTQKNRFGIFFLVLISVSPFVSKAQNLKTTDFVLYGKKVQMASTTTIVKGSVGALSLIQTNGGTSFGGSLYSDSAIVLNNGNTVNGVIKANNSRVASITTGLPINIGSSATLKDSVVGKGNITIQAGTVKQVFLPTGATYSGPNPTLGKVQVAANLLKLPVMPPMPTTIPVGTVSGANITTTTTIIPGDYGNVILSGGQTVTLSGTGTYRFKSIKNSGASNNNFVFDFKGITANFVVLVQGDVDVNKNVVSTINGGGPNYIFFEIMGTGSTASGNAFTIANGASGSDSRWFGTVWAPNGNINLGTGTKGVVVTGAFFTNNTINITSNTTIDYAPYIDVKGGNNPDIIPSFPPVGIKTDNLIGPQLTSLSKNWDGTVTFEDSVFRVINSKVLIDIIVVKGQYNYLLGILPNSPYGMTGFIPNGGQDIITGFYPIANLNALNALTAYISYVRPVSPPKKNSGVTTTNGDIAQKSDAVRNGYHVYGENVTVGVLSDSYNNQGLAPADVGNDDLPGNLINPDVVTVVQDYPYTVFNAASDEGRAMLQIVHDVAPKAKLAFRTGFISEGDFALGVRQLADAPNNCDVIIDDITYITEPFFRDGFVAQSANYVHDHNKTYISAAGNFGAQSYSANFNPVPAPNGMSGYAHNFGTSIYQPLSLTAGIFTIVLQWDNDFYSLGQANPAPNDLDWYLVDNNGGIIVGMNMNNFHRDPIEVLSFQALVNTTANLMVISANGSTTVKFKYIIMRGGATITGYAGSSTIVGQANAAGALAVGAARYTNTPAYGIAPPQIETFSSLGGTPVNGVNRNKPDFVAPDGGNTTIDFHSLNLEDGAHGVPLESPIYPNFFGTSAAAPHAGGVAALLISGSHKFRGTGMASDEIKSLLQSTAIDMASSGPDNISGAGLIQADRAMSTFAAPTPILSAVTVPSGITGPTPTTFTVTVQGQFFSNSSVIYLRDQALTTTIVNSTTATATVNGFTGNPPIRVYTPPISTLQTDGNFSNSINLLNVPKKNVVITADNKSKLYGEPLPAFTSTILVDNVPLANSGLTLQDLGLDNGRIQYTTPANSLSDATNYNIIPSLNPPITTTDPLNELYQYSFGNGALTVNKLPLTITPNDQTITYGDAVNNITFNYTVGSSNISAGDLTTIQSNLVLEHQSSVISNTVALVDTKQISSGFSFSDLGFIASQNSISSTKQISSNFGVIDLSADLFNQYTGTGGNLINTKQISSSKQLSSGNTVVNTKQISSSSTIFNATVGDAAANDNTIVIIDAGDVDAGQISAFTPINLITGLSVGQSDIIPGAFFTADFFSNNFDVHYAPGKLKINPAVLTVKADDKTIFAGDVLPTFTSTITGFKYLDDKTTVINSGPSYSVSPTYKSKAGTYTITPSGIVQKQTPVNYNINYQTGILYVDPKDNSTKNVIPSLDCVSPLVNDPDGYTFVAHFAWSNPNSFTVSVPLGDSNKIIPPGGFAGQPPTVFPPGTGHFDIRFNGVKITWSLTTYNGSQGHSTSSTSEASSTSKKCPGSTTRRTSDVQESTSLVKAGVYPNPAHNKATLFVGSDDVSLKDIRIIDLDGRVFPVSLKNSSTQTVELDLTSLKNGMYFIKVNIKGQTKLFKIEKF
jgi:hypothetical protein